MMYHYESDNLNYDILFPDNADKILDFYNVNRAHFEKYDPDKPENFYTYDYQYTMTKLEHENFMRGKSARFWLSRKSHPEKIIGCISFSNIIKGAFMSATIAYKIHKDHLRMGYATEAVRFLSDVMFQEFGLHRIEAYIFNDNLASIKTIEKCGFKPEGIATGYVFMRGQWLDHLRYSLIAPGNSL